MADLKGENISAKLYLKFGKGASETHEMQKTAFGDNDMGLTHTSK
jgi:hypothetical protein